VVDVFETSWGISKLGELGGNGMHIVVPFARAGSPYSRGVGGVLLGGIVVWEEEKSSRGADAVL